MFVTTPYLENIDNEAEGTVHGCEEELTFYNHPGMRTKSCFPAHTILLTAALIQSGVRIYEYTLIYPCKDYLSDDKGCRG